MDTDKLKGKIKDAFNKVAGDKSTVEKVKEDIGRKDYSGAANTVKEKLKDSTGKA